MSAVRRLAKWKTHLRQQLGRVRILGTLEKRHVTNNTPKKQNFQEMTKYYRKLNINKEANFHRRTIMMNIHRELKPLAQMNTHRKMIFPEKAKYGDCDRAKQQAQERWRPQSSGR